MLTKQIGLESILYQTFMQKYSVWRSQDLVRTIDISTIKDFPGQTVFHLLDDMNNTIPAYIPKNNPFLLISSNKKYIKHILTFKRQNSDIIELMDKGITLPMVNWQKTVNEFTHTYGKVLRPILPNTKDPVLNNSTQLFINYNFMFRAVSRGVLSGYKKFNYIFSGMLNTLMEYPEHTHFINIPIPTDISVTFKRNDFDRTFNKIDQSTLRYPDFPHYIFFVYLFNFIHNDSELGLINIIPQHMWKKINFIVNNETECVIYNLQALKDLNSGTHVETETEDLGSDRIIYKVLDQINKLCSYVSEENYIEPIRESLVTISNDSEEGNIPKVTNVISALTEPSSGGNHRILTKGIELEVDTKAKERVENNENLTERQKAKALVNAVAYKKLSLGGQTVDEILHNTDNNIDTLYIKALEGKVADESMLESKIINFDNSYMTKTFKQDLLGVLTTFNGLGLFLTDLKEEDLSDEMNQVMLYTAKFTDMTGASHPAIKIPLPKVDEDGRCYMNGVYRMMKKQRVNNPICKVSPTRISLTSSYNKCLVERSPNKQFYPNFVDLLKRGNPEIDLGNVSVPGIKLPYEYDTISRKITKFTLRQHTFTFDYKNRFNGFKEAVIPNLKELESKYGVYCGSKDSSNSLFFMDMYGHLYEIDKIALDIIDRTTISNKVATISGVENKYFYEYVQVKLLSKNIPLGFVLCYRFGLEYMLRYLKTDYRVYAKRDKFKQKVDDVCIEFKDTTLVIPRAPLLNSSIFAGLCVFNTKKYNIDQMNDPDTYYDMMSYKGNTNYLKGIDSFFDLFIGYIEYKVLKQMNEPTEMKDLLIRAAMLLTTNDHKEPSASINFRLRGYEKFNHIIYNELARAYSTWIHKSIGHSNRFSIHPFVIAQRINEDGLFDKLDTINPIHQIKAKTAYSHLGEGGRTADTFMIGDRRFTKDSIGILSVATVDNSSVGINGCLSVDPNVLNTSGLTLPKDIGTIKPTEILSVTSLLFPCLTQDDQLI